MPFDPLENIPDDDVKRVQQFITPAATGDNKQPDEGDSRTGSDKGDEGEDIEGFGFELTTPHDDILAVCNGANALELIKDDLTAEQRKKASRIRTNLLFILDKATNSIAENWVE